MGYTLQTRDNWFVNGLFINVIVGRVVVILHSILGNQCQILSLLMLYYIFTLVFHCWLNQLMYRQRLTISASGLYDDSWDFLEILLANMLLILHLSCRLSMEHFEFFIRQIYSLNLAGNPSLPLVFAHNLYVILRPLFFIKRVPRLKFIGILLHPVTYLLFDN